MDVAKAKTLKVPELKKELSALSLSANGKKDELLARLVAHLEANSKKETATPAQTTSATSTNGTPSPTAAKAPTAQPPTTNTASTTPAATATTATAQTEEERRRARLARFGLPTAPAATAPVMSEVERRKAREARFAAAGAPGTVDTKTTGATPGVAGAKTAPAVASPTSPSAYVGIDAELLKKRQERFGIKDPKLEKVIAASEEEERKRKRAERFGLSAATSQVSAPAAAKKQKV
ncbi:hypothetical protein HDV00_011880 [Rhizophlyctis rosea]|nr:hypothetical protein HDV00_011880 [Rhizophlyctis rosea]